MTLRARLTVIILLVVVLPVVVGGVIVEVMVPGALRDQVTRRLEGSRAAVGTVLAERCTRAGVTARALALGVSASGAQKAVDDVLAQREADYAAVLAGDGSVIAQSGSLPDSVGEPGRMSPCTAPPGQASQAPVITQRVDLSVPGQPDASTVVVAFRMDGGAVRALARTLALTGGLTLAADGRAVASTLAPGKASEVARDAGGAPAGGPVHTQGLLGVVAPPDAGRPFSVVVTGDPPDTRPLLAGTVGIGLAVVALAALFGWLLARDLTRPLAELTRGAERVAHGDHEVTIPVRSRDEVGRLAVAFNEMTDRIHGQLDELARGRDALRANLDRVGDALSRSHDLDGILEVVLDTAVTAVTARSGEVYLATHGSPILRRATRPRHGGETDLSSVVPGQGVLGRVVTGGSVVRGYVGEPGFEPGPDEPQAGSVLAAPLRRAGQTVGVLALFDRVDGAGFSEVDEGTIRSLVAQADVAADNVLLHEEAQRLSITDALTGLWNYRYLAMSLDRELDRATRFDRPVALLMLDLDEFKGVNDLYGHQRGDAVLRELARRVGDQIREVDTFARYGGEEFVLVLPETDATGAGLVAERVCRAVREQPFEGPGNGQAGQPSLHVTASVGGALFPTHGRTPASLLAAADDALYAAKRAGRDRWCIVGGPADLQDDEAPADLPHPTGESRSPQ